MNAAQEQMYERALERAHNEQLKVTLLESWGAHVYNPKYAEGYYTVRFEGSQMTCNCAAGQRGLYCKHRAIVREALAKKQESERAVLCDRAWKNAYATRELEQERAAYRAEQEAERRNEAYFEERGRAEWEHIDQQMLRWAIG